jgi:hypothetical protein
MIASQFHSGQASALYSLASCGAIDLERLHAEYFVIHSTPEMPGADKRKLDHLGIYFLEHGDRGPVAGWAQLSREELRSRPRPVEQGVPAERHRVYRGGPRRPVRPLAGCHYEGVGWRTPGEDGCYRHQRTDVLPHRGSHCLMGRRKRDKAVCGQRRAVSEHPPRPVQDLIRLGACQRRGIGGHRPTGVTNGSRRCSSV